MMYVALLLANLQQLLLVAFGESTTGGKVLHKPLPERT
jgi:hypothetical protein